MTKELQTKLARIYEVIADKELSFGCRVIDDEYYEKIIITDENKLLYDNGLPKYGYDVRLLELDDRGIVEIIGHPVMLGDVLDWINKNGQIIDDEGVSIKDKGFVWFDDIVKAFAKPRKPIEEQSEECIDFIYGLLGDD